MSEGSKGAHTLRGLPGRGEKVLIVEDDENLRTALARMLKNLGFSVLTATDGEDAIDVIEHTGETIDVLLTDVVMPRLDGPGLVDRLRAAGIRPPVVYMSGYENGATHVSRPVDEGVPLLHKPFTPHAVVFVLREVLDHRK